MGGPKGGPYPGPKKGTEQVCNSKTGPRAAPLIKGAAKKRQGTPNRTERNQETRLHCEHNTRKLQRRPLTNTAKGNRPGETKSNESTSGSCFPIVMIAKKIHHLSQINLAHLIVHMHQNTQRQRRVRAAYHCPPKPNHHASYPYSIPTRGPLVSMP